MKYVYTGNHAEILADGRPVAPGQEIELNVQARKHPHHKRLIAERKLREVPTRLKPQQISTQRKPRKPQEVSKVRKVSKSPVAASSGTSSSSSLNSKSLSGSGDSNQ